jgi:GT2 family glycosyltransferase
METFDVSLIIPTYNRSDLLDYTLQNICDQKNAGIKMQVIVVDDGSSDDTKDIVKKYVNKLFLEYLYQEDQGYRLSTARNLGIWAAKGTICLFLDPGILIGKTFVEEHLRIHRKNKKPVAVIGYVFGIDQKNLYRKYLTDLVDVKCPENTFKALMSEDLLLDIREECYELCNGEINNLPAPWALFWGNNNSLPRSVIEKVGFFDEKFNFNWGMEDVEFGYRLYKENISFELNREAKALHYPHDNDWKSKSVQEYINKTYFDQKYKTKETRLLMDSDTVKLNADLIQQELKIRF